MSFPYHGHFTTGTSFGGMFLAGIHRSLTIWMAD